MSGSDLQNSGKQMGVLLERYARLTTFMMDLDGVLTDGYDYCTDEGEVLRGLHVRDGFALQYALRMGYNVCVLSGSKSSGVRARLERLGVTDVYMGVPFKMDVFLQYKTQKSLRGEEIVYIGNDMPDLDVMKQVGLAVAPCDAANDILQVAHYITNVGGGRGCVREIIENVLKLQEKWYTPQTFSW